MPLTEAEQTLADSGTVMSEGGRKGNADKVQQEIASGCSGIWVGLRGRKTEVEIDKKRTGGGSAMTLVSLISCLY